MSSIRYFLPVVVLSLIAVTVGCSLGVPATTDIPLSTITPSTILPSTISITETIISTPLPEIFTQGPTETLINNLPMATSTVMVSKALYQLTFISERSEKWGIYAIDVHCLNEEEACLDEPKLLFEQEERIKDYDWSPDGTKLAISTGYGGILFMADWNGKNAVQVTDDCGAANWPRWSPDGTQIAFIYNPGQSDCDYLGPSQIQIYDVETGQITSLFPDVYGPIRIYWLPRGDMAYISDNSETDHTRMIHIVSNENTEICQLPENAREFSYIVDVSFSADYNQMAYAGWKTENEGSILDIFVINYCESEKSEVITKEIGNSGGPAWSPVGNWIAFFSGQERHEYDIYLIKPDGTGLINVTSNSEYDIIPAWRFLDKPR